MVKTIFMQHKAMLMKLKFLLLLVVVVGFLLLFLFRFLLLVPFAPALKIDRWTERQGTDR